jgi:hypothetical protein
MTVSVMFVQTAFVPVNSRQNCEGMRAVCYRKRDSLAPSEGRGHRFESCRVRQFSAIYFLTSQNVFGVC